uniref:Uncharacterized protein n=1 Tax=Caenorhabditis japonica TaxID=281687 RepID=A0A8R1I805_CAEJA
MLFVAMPPILSFTGRSRSFRKNLPTGKRRNSHQQLYKGLVSFETSGQLVSQISINRESFWYLCPSRLSSRKQLNIIQNLKGATKAEWDPITEAELKTLVVHMPNRVIEVIQKFGGDTKY